MGRQSLNDALHTIRERRSIILYTGEDAWQRLFSVSAISALIDSCEYTLYPKLVPLCIGELPRNIPSQHPFQHPAWPILINSSCTNRPGTNSVHLSISAVPHSQWLRGTAKLT